MGVCPALVRTTPVPVRLSTRQANPAGDELAGHHAREDGIAAFDTLAAARKLERAGLQRDAAEAVAFADAVF